MMTAGRIQLARDVGGERDVADPQLRENGRARKPRRVNVPEEKTSRSSPTKKEARDILRNPRRHVAKSTDAKFPLGEEAHLPQDATEAAQFVSDNESNLLNLP